MGLRKFLGDYVFNFSSFVGGIVGTGTVYWFALGLGGAMDLYQRTTGVPANGLESFLHSNVNIWEIAGYGGFFGGIAGVGTVAKARGWIKGAIYSFLKK